jgi:hypothetical protein
MPIARMRDTFSNAYIALYLNVVMKLLHVDFRPPDKVTSASVFMSSASAGRA